MAIAIKATPLEYAKSRLAFWQKRLETAEATPIGRGTGKWLKWQKFSHTQLCLGAIAALKEVTEATYLPTVDGRKR